MKALEAARRSYASNVYTMDTPCVIHNRESHQRMRKTEVRQSHEDDEKRAAFIEERWARLLAREKH